MNIIEELCERFYGEKRGLGKESEKYCRKGAECKKLYDELRMQLSEEQKRKLYVYDDELGVLSVIANEDGFREGFVTGLGFLMRMFVDMLSMPLIPSEVL